MGSARSNGMYTFRVKVKIENGDTHLNFNWCFCIWIDVYVAEIELFFFLNSGTLDFECVLAFRFSCTWMPIIELNKRKQQEIKIEGERESTIAVSKSLNQDFEVRDLCATIDSSDFIKYERQALIRSHEFSRKFWNLSGWNGIYQLAMSCGEWRFDIKKRQFWCSKSRCLNNFEFGWESVLKINHRSFFLICKIMKQIEIAFEFLKRIRQIKMLISRANQNLLNSIWYNCLLSGY